jgi:hypothetical protein
VGVLVAVDVKMTPKPMSTWFEFTGVAWSQAAENWLPTPLFTTRAADTVRYLVWPTDRVPKDQAASGPTGVMAGAALRKLVLGSRVSQTCTFEAG